MPATARRFRSLLGQSAAVRWQGRPGTSDRAAPAGGVGQSRSVAGPVRGLSRGDSPDPGPCPPARFTARFEPWAGTRSLLDPGGPVAILPLRAAERTGPLMVAFMQSHEGCRDDLLERATDTIASPGQGGFETWMSAKANGYDRRWAMSIVPSPAVSSPPSSDCSATSTSPRRRCMKPSPRRSSGGRGRACPPIRGPGSSRPAGSRPSTPSVVGPASMRRSPTSPRGSTGSLPPPRKRMAMGSRTTACDSSSPAAIRPCRRARRLR